MITELSEADREYLNDPERLKARIASEIEPQRSSGDSGYRRGYCHGYLQALEDRDKHPRHKLGQWAMIQLYRWRSKWSKQYEPPRYPNECEMNLEALRGEGEDD